MQKLLQRVSPDILAFFAGLAIAYQLQWQTTDLVWSLWLSSLVLGFLTLFSAIGSAVYIGLHAVRHPDTSPAARLPLLASIAIGSLFFLGFFSIHFGGFHAGHATFLSSFFPLEGLSEQGFSDAFMNPPLLWALTFEHLIAPYGIFLLPMIVAERNHLFGPLVKAVRAVREAPDGAPVSKPKIGVNGAMSRPYLNVIRMHLLIFFFAFCHFMSLESFAVYAVVYSVYFFPWAEFKRLLKDRKERHKDAQSV